MPRFELQNRYIRELLNVEDAKSPEHAVALWWAHQTADPQFNTDLALDEKTSDAQIVAQGRAERRLPRVLPYLADFSDALHRATASEQVTRIETTPKQNPDEVLQRAALVAGMPVDGQYTFPPNTYTEIRENVAIASLGKMGIEEQIWPPKANS